MTASNAAVDKTAEKSGAEKAHEKLAEKRRALGRGLESLLPGPRAVAAAPTVAPPDVAPPAALPQIVDELQAATAGHAPDGEHAFELALDKIDENPHQTRQEFDAMALGDLAGSIQTQGVLQPIVVRPGGLRPGGEQRFIMI